MRKTVLVLASFLFLQVVTLCGETIRIYHIGNSLTADSNLGLTIMCLQNEGHRVEQGYHIACGKSLAQIVDDPGTVCIAPREPYGTWTNALTNFEWDKVTIQAYPGQTALEEVNATRKIIEAATSGNRNRKCTFFLLLAWPSIDDSLSFSDLINSPFRGADAPTLLSSGFLDYWYQEVTAMFPDLDVRVIPTGLALREIDQKLADINIGPYTNAYALYRDLNHMAQVGGHLTGSMMLCTLSEIRPEKHIYADGYLSFVNTLPNAYVKLVSDIVWYSITADPRTKVTTPPEVSVSYNRLGNVYECSFLGRLYHCTDGKTWTEIRDSSPYRFHPTYTAELFRGGR